MDGVFGPRRPPIASQHKGRADPSRVSAAVTAPLARESLPPESLIVITPVDRTGDDGFRLVRCTGEGLFDSMETGNMPLKGEYEPSTMQLVRDQVELYESSGGTEGTTLSSLIGPEDAKRRDLPVILLTTLGAKSGKIRKSPLMRVEHDGSYAVVASLGGAPKHPIWYHNVVADPRVELQDGPVRQDMLAREVTGDEKAVWWARAVEAFPDYAEYQKKTDREIPVFVLDLAAEEH
jgi:deazaflavin-dependent oxidoreductase (nitroreductase family)